MKRIKRVIALLLWFTLSACMMVNVSFAAEPELPFTDVSSSKWYYDDVKIAYENGLITGKTDTQFAPGDNLTYAEAVKLAACMHQKYTTGKVTLETGYPWYQTYVDYCKEHGIIASDYNWGEKATRAGYMEIFANALPEDALIPVTKVDDGMIPDVPMDHPQAEAIYSLYRAGILQGSDDAHSCRPDDNISRSEVAAILTRMMNQEKRPALEEAGVYGDSQTDAEDAHANAPVDPCVEKLLDLDLSELQAVNEDVIGWIEIPDTPISYPLVQGDDNEYYLTHNWKREYSPGGAIFMEIQNPPDFSYFNTLIYGHRMSDSSMFNSLRHYERQEYLEQHPRIYIATEQGVRVYEVFAAMKVPVKCPVYWIVINQEEYMQKMIDYCLDSSVIESELVPSIENRVLILSTCTGLSESNYRWVVVASETEIVSR